MNADDHADLGLGYPPDDNTEDLVDVSDNVSLTSILRCQPRKVRDKLSTTSDSKPQSLHGVQLRAATTVTMTAVDDLHGHGDHASTVGKNTTVDDLHGRCGRAAKTQVSDNVSPTPNSKKPPVSSAKTTTEGYQNHNHQEADPS
ncbi:hypothetical protein nbrc107696_01500 [Gordonia spumicola]|uniref:Uncharacterized protein n=1 Tax=Gordonia spumicola TaxID=589161 RepID=A0A7I9V3F1_9ACTN|nr:hypothetical protein [Gordonia spumicola]GED99703.1 hypothetical protein nbrc107696_01500 [Gordonia spumicola]